jgi:predicted alpha/beta hydrolase family esterase
LPDYEEWKKVFERNEIDGDTILIGHSAGGGFLVRWLGETKKKIRKLILISPGKAGKARNFGRSNLYGKTKILNIGKYVREGIVVFTSNDDIPSHIVSASEYEKELPAKVISLENHGHFTLEDMGTKKFPELLEEISK